MKASENGGLFYCPKPHKLQTKFSYNTHIQQQTRVQFIFYTHSAMRDKPYGNAKSKYQITQIKLSKF